MLEPGPKLLYRLRGNVAGVHWRPTQFAEAVSNISICGLCHKIPKKTVTLPCEHFLCESCLTASANDGGGISPLDGEACVEDECSWNAFADRKAKTLKAHCWNQPHGCEFVGTIDAVLRHYEAECAFHLVECQQCGVQVLHDELLTHRMAGCRGGTPLPTTDHSDTVTMGDVRAAVEELKVFMRDPHHDELPPLHSQMNQLMEQCRQYANETIRLLTESAEDVKWEVSRIASIVQEIHSRSVPQEEVRAGTFEVGTCQESIPWRMEKMLILRRLEMFTKHVLNSLEQLRQNNEPDGTAR